MRTPEEFVANVIVNSWKTNPKVTHLFKLSSKLKSLKIFSEILEQIYF